MKKVALKMNYVQVPNETAKAVERKAKNPISLQALGLITNIWSYDVENWDLYKKELYNRYEKNKETSVRNAWNELVDAKYIIEFQYRNSEGKFDNVYYYRIEPFSEEEIKAINDAEKTALENPVRENGSGKTGMDNQVVSNEKPLQEKQQNKNQEKINPKPLNLEIDLNKLNMPIQVLQILEKNREKVKGLNIDLFELERFINTYQWYEEITNDIEYINKFDIQDILHYIFENNVTVKKTTYGLFKEMALTKIFFKKENVNNSYEVDVNKEEYMKQNNLPFYDWLNA